MELFFALPMASLITSRLLMSPTICCIRGSFCGVIKRASISIITSIGSWPPEGPVSLPRLSSVVASCEPRKPPPPVMIIFISVASDIVQSLQVGQQAAVIHVALAALHHGVEESVQELGDGEFEAKAVGGPECIV